MRTIDSKLAAAKFGEALGQALLLLRVWLDTADVKRMVLEGKPFLVPEMQTQFYDRITEKTVAMTDVDLYYLMNPKEKRRSVDSDSATTVDSPSTATETASTDSLSIETGSNSTWPTDSIEQLVTTEAVLHLSPEESVALKAIETEAIFESDSASLNLNSMTSEL